MALDALRSALAAGRAVSLAPEGDALLLDGLRVPRGTLTSYRSATGGHYALDALWFFYENRALEHAAYMQAARLANVGFVSRVDRVDLINYLSGEVQSSAKLDPDFRDDAAWREAIATRLKRPADAPVVTPAASMATGDVTSAAVAKTDAAPVAKRARTDGKAARPAPSASAARKVDDSKAPVDPAVAEGISAVVSHERVLRDRTTVLLSDKSFEFVYRVVREAQAKAAALAKEKSARPDDKRVAGGAAGAAGVKPGAARAGRSSGALPIIVVPGSSSHVTMLNIKEFLEQSSYVDPAEKQKQSPVRENEIVVRRPNAPEGQPKAFRVIDIPKRLKPGDWNNIVCIFVNGREWQLKDYIEVWKTPAEIFSRVLGVHVKFDDEKLEDTVKNWNVTVLSINRFKRHLDATALEKFWKKVDVWMSLHGRANAG